MDGDKRSVLGEIEWDEEVEEGVGGGGRQGLGLGHPQSRAMNHRRVLVTVNARRKGLRRSRSGMFGRTNLTVEWEYWGREL